MSSITVVMLIAWMAASAAQGAEPAFPAGDAPEPAAPGTALRLAPECDRAVVVQVDGVPYAVAALHNRWRLAAATFRARDASGLYRLTVAFRRDGTLAEVFTVPPRRRDFELAEACADLQAGAICPVNSDERTPLALLHAAARHFARIRADGRLERAVLRALAETDTVTGATP